MRRFTLLFLLALHSLLVRENADLVSAVPFYMLQNSASRCFLVDAPRDTTLNIHYQAPDMMILPEDDSKEAIEEARRQNKESAGEQGLDSRWNERFNKKLELMKSRYKNRKDVEIMVVARDESFGRLPGAYPKPTNKGTKRLREQLTNREGNLEFDTGDTDGIVEICVQSLSASKDAPSRVALNVTNRPTDVEGPETNPLNQTTIADLGDESMEKLQFHTSGISQELHRLENRLRDIQANSEYARDREAKFYDQSVKLHSAVRYWPMFRIFILFAAGYMQVSQVISYMRRKHIY